MREVLAQKADVPFDMPNPAYRFGYGLNYPEADLRSQRNEP
jgi:hypothetical protein